MKCGEKRSEREIGRIVRVGRSTDSRALSRAHAANAHHTTSLRTSVGLGLLHPLPNRSVGEIELPSYIRNRAIAISAHSNDTGSKFVGENSRIPGVDGAGA